MPAYRSSAEGEIRDAVVDRIRKHRPNARIIHEINVSTYGPNRIDLVAVDTAEIIAVEIKSAKDKLDRLPAQIASMRNVAHHVIAAVHEKFMTLEHPANEKSSHFSRDGKFYYRTLPDDLRWKCTNWIYPERVRAADPSYDFEWRWEIPKPAIQSPLPEAALSMLWRDELEALCNKLRVSIGRRSTMETMANALRWHCNGRELTLGICESLRRRQCVEADPIMEAA